MFRSSLNRILDWAEGALAPIDEEWGTDEGFSGAIDDEYQPVDYDEYQAPAPMRHPHRRELRWERVRRPGSVPRAPAHCISPVGRKVVARTREDSERYAR